MDVEVTFLVPSSTSWATALYFSLLTFAESILALGASQIESLIFSLKEENVALNKAPITVRDNVVIPAITKLFLVTTFW